MTPLLSITIPTWNRAKYLNGALERIITQIGKYSNKIELIVSNNGSTDDTKELLHKTVALFPNLTIKVFNHEINTGYFGNFKKCRELAVGKYIWLLSDDDYICNGVIDEVMRVLGLYDDIGLIFLEDWYSKDKVNNLTHNKPISFTNFWNQYYHRMTLISSTIFLNLKENDDLIYQKFDQNVFLGFIFLLYGVRNNPNCVVVLGRSLEVSVAKRSYNFFNAWLLDMYNILAHLVENRIISDEMRIGFINSFLKNVLLEVYLDYRYNGVINESNSFKSFEELNRKLKQTYGNVSVYKTHFQPFLLLPKISIPIYFLSRKVFRKLKKISAKLYLVSIVSFKPSL